MERKRKFTIYYNSNKNLGCGEGYYVIFENNFGEPTVDSKYGILEYNKDIDMVSVGLINKLYQMYDLGYIFDKYYTFDFEKLF